MPRKPTEQSDGQSSLLKPVRMLANSALQPGSEIKGARSTPTRRPISETWTKARTPAAAKPLAESSKENLGRKGVKIVGTTVRSPFQERHACPSAVDIEMNKRLKMATTGEAKCPIVQSHLQRSKLASENQNFPQDPLVDSLRDNGADCSGGSGQQLSRKPTISSLFSKLGNLSEKIHQIQNQNLDLEVIPRSVALM